MEIRKVLKLGTSRAIILPRSFPTTDYCIIRCNEEGKVVVEPLTIASLPESRQAGVDARRLKRGGPHEEERGITI